MKKFNYIAPETIEEVSALISDSRSMLSAGATDIIGELKENILPHYPENLVSLKNVKGLDNISVESDGLHIGAMATLKNISSSSEVRKGWSALADAAYSVASPNIRTSATIGGNICQDIRCWYYRYPNTVGGMINCARKEGVLCSAMMGENRYHSIFGAARVVHMAAADHVNRYGGVQGKHGYYETGIVAAASAAESLRMLRATYPQLFMLLDGFDYPNANARNCSFAFDRFGHGAVACAGTVITGAHLKAEEEDWRKAALAAADRVKKNLTRYVQIL